MGRPRKYVTGMAVAKAADNTVLEQYRQHSRELRADLDKGRAEGMASRDLSILHERFGKSLDRIAKIEGVDLTAAKIVKLPAWGTVEDCIIAALKPFPDAAKAVADALVGLDEP